MKKQADSNIISSDDEEKNDKWFRQLEHRFWFFGLTSQLASELSNHVYKLTQVKRKKFLALTYTKVTFHEMACPERARCSLFIMYG